MGGGGGGVEDCSLVDGAAAGQVWTLAADSPVMSVMLVSVISGPAQSLTSTSSSSVLLEMLFILLGHTETTDEGGGELPGNMKAVM